MKRNLSIFIIIGLCIIFSESVSYGFALNIGPSTIQISVKPGGTHSGTVTVTNNGEKSIGVRAYVQDWLYNSNGSKSFYGAGTTPLSCAKWIRTFPKKFQLEAGTNMGVQYTINVPEDVQGGYYAVMFFESVPLIERGESEDMLVQFAGRLGTIVYLETKGSSVRKGTIESLSITPPQSNKPLQMSLSFKNMGNVYIGAEGTLNIIDEEGNIFGRKILEIINTLPGETREAKAEWLGELEEGTYYAVVTLDIGTEDPIVREAELVVSSGGAIKDISVDTSLENPSFSISVENRGDLNINTSGRIEILNTSDELIKSLTLKKSLIAPGREKELKAALEEKLPPGRYTAKAVISIGAKELIKEEVFFIK